MRKITNRGELEVELCGRKHRVESNEVMIEPIKIEIEQEQPCKFVLEKDIIHFVFRVINKSRTNIFDLIFRNKLSEFVEFVPDSFRINGRREPAFVRGNVLEAKIRELKECETLNICFDVRTREFQGDECREECERPCPCEPCRCEPRNSNLVFASQL